MSREHQRFSPVNQKTVIAAYALRHGFEIVETYQDDGKSGLTMTGRPELKRLLRDTLAEDKAFRAILVLDVSRWGRFQDADQAAHYEYMCREAGAPVTYCAEAFDNDGSAMTTLIKQMKRVMAAEFSRELSTKVARAQRQQARLGFKQGAPAVLGTRRQLIDEHGRPRMLLEAGQRKGVSTDRVIFTHGPAREVALVRLVFDLYVNTDLSLTNVAAELNRRRKFHRTGTPWNCSRIRDLISKEILTGTYTFGLKRNNLGKRTEAPEEDHVRVAVMAPIISPEMFQAARQKHDRSRRLYLSDDELLSRLRRLWNETGLITEAAVHGCSYLPGPSVFRSRLGSVRKAALSLGYQAPYRSAKEGWRQSFTDEALLDELRRIHSKHGRLSQQLIDADPCSPHSGLFRARFGSLRAAYRLIGVKPTPFSNLRFTDADGRPMTDEGLIDLLAKLLNDRGYLSKTIIDEEPSCPSSSFYGKRFGGVMKVYERLGYAADHSEIMMRVARRRPLAGAVHDV